MKKIIQLLSILILAISACGGSGGSSVTHPVGYTGPDSSVEPLLQTPSIYSETHYVYDFQGENYLLSCNSSGIGSGQLEIYKEAGGQFDPSEKMTIGGGVGCSGVTSIIDSNNSVNASPNTGILHIFAAELVSSVNYTTYWCWDGQWVAGDAVENHSAENACGSYLNKAPSGGSPSVTIDTSSNELLLAYQLNWWDLSNPSNMDLEFMSYPLTNLTTTAYDVNDWSNPASIDGATAGFSAVGTSPVIKIAGGSIVIIARADNAGLGLKLYHCLLTSDCGQASNWAGGSQFMATNIADTFDFDINPSTGYLTLVYQSDSGGALHPNAIVYREWSISTPLTAGPEKLIAMAYDPIGLAAAKISLGIEPSGKKHVFWWEHQAPFDFVLNHRFEKGNLWDGDIAMGWDGSSITDIPTRMNPVFDNTLSPHGDRCFSVAYSMWDNAAQSSPQVLMHSKRCPVY